MHLQHALLSLLQRMSALARFTPVNESLQMLFVCSLQVENHVQVEDHTNGSACANATFAHVSFGERIFIIAGSAFLNSLQAEGQFWLTAKQFIPSI
jgi:hypothetical protein